MFKNCLLLVVPLFFSFQAYGGGLEEYMLTVNNQCPSINQLIIKKSLIEITQEQNCSSAFTSLLLKECPRINCPQLINYWLSFNASKSGTVIGK